MADEAELAAAAAAPPAAPDINARPPQAVLDPQLFMAARCGDSERLKELLLLRNDGDQQGGPAAATATTTAQVTLEVDPSPAAAPLLHLLDGVTGNEGDSLLHVVAACGDGENFLDCAKTIYRARSGLLVAAISSQICISKNNVHHLHQSASTQDSVYQCLYPYGG